MAVLGPGRRPRPLTFCSAPTPVFPPTTCYCFHPLGARGPGPQSVFARTATGSRFPPLCQISQLWFSKCGLTGLGIANIGNFWYKFSPKGYIPLSDFFYKVWPGDGVPGPHSCTKFHRYVFKNVGLQRQKSPKIFGISLSVSQDSGGL